MANPPNLETKTSSRRFARCRTIVAFAVLAIAGLQLTACTPKPDRKADQNTDRFTGAKTPDGRAQTAAAQDSELARLKARIDISKPENKKLSESISEIRYTRHDQSGKPTETAPELLKVQVTFKAGSYAPPQAEFSIPLTVSGGSVSGESARPNETKEHFRATAVCRDRSCSVVIFSLQLLEEGTSNVVGETAAVLRKKTVFVQAHQGLDPKIASQDDSLEAPRPKKDPSQEIERLASALGKKAEHTMSTTEVAWGVSRFSLDISKHGLCPGGLLVQTNDVDERLTDSCETNTSATTQPVEINLLGNNNRGGLLLRLRDRRNYLYLTVLSPMEGTSKEPVSLEDEIDLGIGNESATTRPLAPSASGAHAPLPPGAPQAPEAPIAPIAPTAPRAPALPAKAPSGSKGRLFIPIDSTHPVTKAWEKDLSRRPIQASIAQWSKSPLMKEFLKRAQPNLPTLTAALKSEGVPPELVFVTLIESRYFIDDGYPIEVSSSGAVGPWQFMPDTAEWKKLGLKIRPLVKDKDGKTMKADPCDERADLEKSTIAAAKYFAFLFQGFPKDPKLAIMSYNWGKKNVRDAMSCLKGDACKKGLRFDRSLASRLRDLRRMDLDFWAVREFNMAPQESIDYVINFIGSQFVGREPEKFGLELPDAASNSYPKAVSSCAGG